MFLPHWINAKAQRNHVQKANMINFAIDQTSHVFEEKKKEKKDPLTEKVSISVSSAEPGVIVTRNPAIGRVRA